MNIGILGYGVYLPLYRMKISQVSSVWGKNESEIIKSLGVVEKTISSYDEDAVTQAYEASKQALIHAGISPSEIEVCLVGSESHPYAVNPTSTIVGEFLGIGQNYLAADLEFACKAATSGVIAVAGLVESGFVQKGLIIGSDAAQAKPHDILEYTASSGACALVLGRKNSDCIATLTNFVSFSSDTPDFWRRDGARFPSHSGRFTGEPAYFTHVEGAARALLSKTKMKPSDFNYCVFHMPNGKFPKEAAKRLGFTKEQLAPSFIVTNTGNPYTASSLLGLASVLDIAKPYERIFMVSYGSGAGSDGFVFETTSNIIEKRKKSLSFSSTSANKKYISYVEYLKFGGKI